MIERIEMLPVSDGTKLYTRILLPMETGKFPIVFQRTPYGEKHRSWRPEECDRHNEKG